MAYTGTIKRGIRGGAQRGRAAVEALEEIVREAYTAAASRLPFHGWQHIDFVRTKAIQFAEERNADVILVAAAALVHDLNYLIKKNSEPSAATELRGSYLKSAGFEEADAQCVERIVNEAHTATRTAQISLEGAALSDADTLFKALPMTPVVFSHLYLEENGMGLRELGRKILEEQVPLMEQDIYFYDPKLRDRYLPWALANIGLWQQVMASLDDPDVVQLLDAVNVRP
jgi:uncharacterized protein